MSQLENLLKLEENHLLMDKLNKQLYILQNGTDIKTDEDRYKQLLNRLKQMEEAVNSGKTKLRHSDHTLKEYELKLMDLDDELYSGSITNEKQLSYLTGERDRISELLEELETEILENMDTIGDVENEIITIKDRVSDFKDEIELNKDKINENINKLEKAKFQLEDNIEKLNKTIDGDLLQKYKRIRVSKGTGIAVVEGGICGGCHIKVPNYLVEDIKKGKIVNCESCNRILCLPKTNIEK